MLDANRSRLRSRPWSVVIALLLVLAVGLLDYFSGYQIYLSIFYLLAISCRALERGTAFCCARRSIEHHQLVRWRLGSRCRLPEQICTSLVTCELPLQS
jgi:hypothetical protein